MNLQVPDKKSAFDPMGCLGELNAALSQPELKSVSENLVLSSSGITSAQLQSESSDDSLETAAQASLVLAEALGNCRLFGVDPGTMDGTLPFDVAILAANRLFATLEDLKKKAERVPQIWDYIFEEIEGELFLSDMLEARMDAWAAFLAIDESYEECLESNAPLLPKFRQSLDRLMIALASFDTSLKAQESILCLAANTEILNTWRTFLARPYNEFLPWWLDGSLEKLRDGLEELAFGEERNQNSAADFTSVPEMTASGTLENSKTQNDRASAFSAYLTAPILRELIANAHTGPRMVWFLFNSAGIIEGHTFEPQVADGYDGDRLVDCIFPNLLLPVEHWNISIEKEFIKCLKRITKSEKIAVEIRSRLPAVKPQNN